MSIIFLGMADLHLVSEYTIESKCLFVLQNVRLQSFAKLDIYKYFTHDCYVL